MQSQQVLVVDDDAVVRELVRLALEQQPGIELVEKASGEEAWLWLQDQPHLDAAILDVNMGDMSGMDLLKKLRSLSPYANLPVIMCTTESERPVIMQAVGLDVRAYIVKPFAPEQVQQAIEKALKT